MRASHYSPGKRRQSCGATKSKRLQQHRPQVPALSEGERLQYLQDTLGAVLIGHKTRRIYRSNKIIRQYRFEFRDLIQFAYTLKQEIAANQDRPG